MTRTCRLFANARRAAAAHRCSPGSMLDEKLDEKLDEWLCDPDRNGVDVPDAELRR